MPGIMVHRISAKRIFEACTDDSIRNIISENSTSYYAGAQGTDNFYFFRYKFLLAGWRTKIYGWAAHHYRPKRYLLTMADYVKEHLTDNLAAYALGYIAHYCLDKHVHRLVLQDAPRLGPHTILENELEVKYSFREGVDPFKAEREKYLHECAKDENREIGRMHKWLLENVYRKVVKCTEDDYSLSFLGWAQAFRNIDEPTEEQRRKIIFRSRFLSFDLKAFLFKQPEDIKDRYGFDRYFAAIDDAIKEAVSYIKLFFDYVEGKTEKSTLENSFENISMQGRVVTPIETKYPILKIFGSKKR